MKESWNIVACGKLYMRPIEDKRKIGEGLVEKINSAFEPKELAVFIKFVLSKSDNILGERPLLYGEAPPNAPFYSTPSKAPSYKKGSFNSKASGKYGFLTKSTKKNSTKNNSSELFAHQPPNYKTDPTPPPSYNSITL